MTFSKNTMMAAAIIFLSLSGIAKAKGEEKSADPKQAEEIQSILNAFEDIEKCDGSQRAENICRSKCTGEGHLWGKGTCSQQEVWDVCSTHCRADWIKDCVATATNKTNNLKGTADCK
ncbi:MAG: hypothetical protein KBD36_04185 [Alphaproteobacteria bacterium]|jgi:hypothetical protein|nr:hypothetical protein [Alphaproteobacteria bacterium]MBP9777022.1 hypothetical protein [Alphaproteobacteria bacterium]